jgi:hypothetical protein
MVESLQSTGSQPRRRWPRTSIRPTLPPVAPPPLTPSSTSDTLTLGPAAHSPVSTRPRNKLRRQRRPADYNEVLGARKKWFTQRTSPSTTRVRTETTSSPTSHTQPRKLNTSEKQCDEDVKYASCDAVSDILVPLDLRGLTGWPGSR